MRCWKMRKSAWKTKRTHTVSRKWLPHFLEKCVRLSYCGPRHASYLPKWKAYELQTWYKWYEYPYHRQAPWPPRSKVNVARSRGPSDRLAHKSTIDLKVPVIRTLVGRLPTRRVIMRTRFEVSRLWSLRFTFTFGFSIIRSDQKIFNEKLANRNYNIKHRR